MWGGAQHLGRVHAAAFSDEVLYAEMVNKAAFWVQQAYFGVNLTHLYAPALAGYFAQVRKHFTLSVTAAPAGFQTG